MPRSETASQVPSTSSPPSSGPVPSGPGIAYAPVTPAASAQAGHSGAGAQASSAAEAQRLERVVDEGDPHAPVGGEGVPDHQAQTLRGREAELHLVDVGRHGRVRPGHVGPAERHLTRPPPTR